MLKKVINTKQDWQYILGLVDKVLGIKPFQVTLDTEFQKRSSKQNRYLHKIFEIIAESQGSTKEHWKAAFKEKHGIKLVYVGLDEQPFVETVSTGDYTPEQLAGFIEIITAHCAEHFDLQILSAEEYLNKE